MNCRTVVLALTVFGAGWAQSQSVMVGAGTGDNSCVDWLAARKRSDIDTQRIYVSWVQGYLSGRNEGLDLTLPKPAEIETLLDDECGKWPGVPAYGHAMRYFRQLGRDQRGTKIPSAPPR